MDYGALSTLLALIAVLLLVNGFCMVRGIEPRRPWRAGVLERAAGTRRCAFGLGLAMIGLSLAQFSVLPYMPGDAYAALLSAACVLGVAGLAWTTVTAAHAWLATG